MFAYFSGQYTSQCCCWSSSESGDIRMIGRCFIRLGRLGDLKKHMTPQSGLICSGMNCSPIFELVNALVVVTIFGANQSLY